MSENRFDSFFTLATGLQRPFDYQCRLACGEQDGRPESDCLAGDAPCQSRLINIPTGLGKTAAVVLAWLWNRVAHPDKKHRQNCPRRLVYCLPMRTVVEQTSRNVRGWIETLGLKDKVGVDVLMGGEEADHWDLYPEREAILIGTQDMLLSRALNRGYGMSRYRWPMHFGLLHSDCLWVFDEIQLMGNGLATTAQLEAVRNKLGQNGCASFWMSATLQRDWLRTVDFSDPSTLPLVKLDEDDLQNPELCRRREARKPLKSATARMDDSRELAGEIFEAHQRAGGRTLVVVNTVKRAREVTRHLERVTKSVGSKPEMVLIHSRFRPGDRRRQMDRLLAEPGEHGMIVISTQVVEAGADVSATTLFTELAPWASLVQRFGRCNRRGKENDKAQVFWVELPDDDK